MLRNCLKSCCGELDNSLRESRNGDVLKRTASSGSEGRDFIQFIRKLPLILLTILLASCGSMRESPVIYISNASLKPITNINCEWSKKHVLTLPTLNPGESRSQSFYIKDPAEFFGLVKISWTNGKNEKITREFFFRKVNLPSINDHTTYNYVQLYFDQNYVEVTTSDMPDLSGKTKKMDDTLVFYKNLYAKGHEEENTKLIEVQPRRDNMTPASVLGYYPF